MVGMGRPLFTGFLRRPSGSAGPRGVRRDGRFASWDSLRERGADQREHVQPGRAYLIDPTAGLETFASLFAVATVPDVMLLWAVPETLRVGCMNLAPALYEVPVAPGTAIDRPLWGIMTSGTSGTPKLPVGYADALELTALHYNTSVFGRAFPGGPDTLATCLPLQFSAAFFMAVLPALFFGYDLLVFPSHDWRELCETAARAHVVCQSVPVLTAAGGLSLPGSADMSRAAILMGGGYVTASRVRTIRERFRDVVLANIYGTAETGVITVDWAPGTAGHVGCPIPGKPVWLRDRGPDGVGRVATAGPDCRRYLWVPGGPLNPAGEEVASTDYGHFDADGNLYLDGRVDGGEKLHGVTIYPRGIERHILNLDGVADVRVLVDPSADVLVARVVGDASEGEVRAWCYTLPEIERPGRVACIPERESLSAYSGHGKL
jgi:acyl-coenzyme A synthetase/AMP-(fatty) acid ligase